MKLFKNLFGLNQNTNPVPSQQNKNNSIEIRTVTKFNEVDNEFIDLLYFPNEEKRMVFKNQLFEIINQLGISNETQRTELMERFPNYLIEKKIVLPFIAELFIFKTSIVKILLTNETEIELIEGHFENRGKEKLQNYYTALRLASHNLFVKKENSIPDISDEENLVLKSISDEHKDFACANILLQLGNSFMLQKNFDKMELYYEKLFSTNFDLSLNTISDFIRAAGEDFYKVGNLQNALKFLKKGLELNPKLGVKKLVAEIEKKTNS